jgi:hypothetical protein
MPITFNRNLINSLTGHCIEQLRQYVMCSGDLTPIPTRYVPALRRNYVDSDFPPHTCRNFDKIHQWIMERAHGSLAVLPHFRGFPNETV